MVKNYSQLWNCIKAILVNFDLVQDVINFKMQNGSLESTWLSPDVA